MSIRIDRDSGAGEMLVMMAADDNFDLLIAFVHSHFGGGGDVTANSVVKQYYLGDMNGKPMMVVMSEDGRYVADGDGLADVAAEVRSSFITAGVPIYPNIERAARAAVKVIDYYRRCG